ncbi:MAG: DUF47 family protein, partial [Bacteroidetes bacterium]|nr:DUF47 family protein [Bacteroidota bacterium]
MISLFRSTNIVISQIDDFLNTIDQGILVFKKGIKAYLKNDKESFSESLEEIDDLEQKADNLRRDIENSLYRHSLIPEFRGDVMELLERMDDLIDIAKESLNQFDIETPEIPDSLIRDYLDLTKTSVNAAESLVMSAKAFFRDVQSVKDHIHRVLYYEKEADKISDSIKRKIFKGMPELHLSRK